MARKPILALLVLTSLAAGCSSGKKENDPLLKEAACYHQQATDVQEKLAPTIEQVDSLKSLLLIIKTPVNQATAATLDSLKVAFEEWEKNLVEVPGMPHEHHHGKGAHEHRHHADATLKDLLADQMRDLQRETLNNIRQIQSRLEQILP